MRIKSRWTTIVGATTVALFFAQAADASPRGWKCSYKVVPLATPFFRETGPYYYACYGRSLRETRARARRECRRLANCTTGACLPLEYVPGRTCERDP